MSNVAFVFELMNLGFHFSPEFVICFLNLIDILIYISHSIARCTENIARSKYFIYKKRAKMDSCPKFATTKCV